MTALTIWLLAAGTADIVVGTGQPQPWRRVIGAAAGIGTAIVAAASLGATARSVATIAAPAALAVGCWTAAQALRVRWVPLALYGLVTVAFVVVGPAWPPPDGGAVGKWLDDSPYASLRGPFEDVTYVLAVAVHLIGTSNVLVRLVLDNVSNEPLKAEGRLRGGRIIGPLERLLLFALVMADELTAIGFVVSAKAFLRFPEIRASEKDIDEVTEYFLIGSATSWTLALLPALLSTA